MKNMSSNQIRHHMKHNVAMCRTGHEGNCDMPMMKAQKPKAGKKVAKKSYRSPLPPTLD